MSVPENEYFLAMSGFQLESALECTKDDKKVALVREELIEDLMIDGEVALRAIDYTSTDWRPDSRCYELVSGNKTDGSVYPRQIVIFALQSIVNMTATRIEGKHRLSKYYLFALNELKAGEQLSIKIRTNES